MSIEIELNTQYSIVNSCTPSETRLSENEWLVLTDLSQSEFDYHSMIDVICDQVGILHEQLLLVWASPGALQ